MDVNITSCVLGAHVKRILEYCLLYIVLFPVKILLNEKKFTNYYFNSVSVDSNHLANLLKEARKEETTLAKLNVRDKNSVWQYFGLFDKAKERVMVFYEHRIGDLRLFARSWEIVLGELSCPDSFAMLDLIVSRVMEPSFDQLKEFIVLLDEGKADTCTQSYISSS